ncbi:MAG: cysteine desulfurase [Candidatus Cloacimonadota bacterium]|nr:MAG: cysteine desulfurase [Candidatus Cloacimonadota bacterium]
MDIKKIRDDFKILKKDVIYLDSAATSLTPDSVIKAVEGYYYDYNANIERGVYSFSQEASRKYEVAHKKVADFFGVDENEIVFTKNCTYGINFIAHSLRWKKGDRIITTLLEHHSNYLPWLRLKDRYGVEVIKIKPSKKGFFKLKDFKDAINPKTKLVAVTHVSNCLGTIVPVAEIGEIAHKKNALILVDGAQSAPHFKINLKDLGCDFFSCSGHKMLGPTGTGILYIKDDLRGKIEPFEVGGGMIKSVDIDTFSVADGWEGFEAGTPNIAGGIGLGEAVEYLKNIGMENIERYERKLTKKLLNGLKSIKKITIFGPGDPKKRTGVIPFKIPDISPHEIAFALDEVANIAIRSGFHCCHPFLSSVLNEQEGTARASLYFYNTEEEVDIFIQTLKEVI